MEISAVAGGAAASHAIYTGSGSVCATFRLEETALLQIPLTNGLVCVTMGL